MTEPNTIDFDAVDKLIDDQIKKEASTEKYFKNVQDFQKKLGDALEAIRIVKDHSFGLVNTDKYRGKIQNILDDMIDLLRETETERDGLNKKRFNPIEVEDNTPKESGGERSPQEISESGKVAPLEKL